MMPRNVLSRTLHGEGPIPSYNDHRALLATVKRAANEQPVTLDSTRGIYVPPLSNQMLIKGTLGVATDHHDDLEKLNKSYTSDQMRTIEADYEDLDSTIREYEPGLRTEIDAPALLALTDKMGLLPEPDKKTSSAGGVKVPEKMPGGTATQEDVSTGGTTDELQTSRLRFRETAPKVKDTK